MKASTIVIVGCFFVLATYVRAGIIMLPEGDPEVEVREPSESGNGGLPSESIAGLHFTFTTPSGTSPMTPSNSDGTPCMDGTLAFNCDFINVSGVTWKSLLIIVTPTPGPTFCQLSFGFDKCNSPEPSTFEFSGGLGVPPNLGFGVTLIGFDASTKFDVTANVPEPGSALLLSAGLIVLLVIFKPDFFTVARM